MTNIERLLLSTALFSFVSFIILVNESIHRSFEMLEETAALLRSLKTLFIEKGHFYLKPNNDELFSLWRLWITNIEKEKKCLFIVLFEL